MVARMPSLCSKRLPVAAFAGPVARGCSRLWGGGCVCVKAAGVERRDDRDGLRFCR